MRSNLLSIGARIKPQTLIWLVLLGAYALQFYQLDARTFHGDELGSWSDAGNLQKNLQALSYFAMLRLWMNIGNSEFFLRTLSAFFAVLSVAVNYVGIGRLVNRQLALSVCTLLATAPFVLEYAQQVRFYTLFLLAASASLWSFLLYLQNPSRRRRTVWITTTILALTTHAMAVLLVLAELATLLMRTQRLTRRQKLVTTGLAVLCGIAVALSPARAIAFNFLASYTDATLEFSASRGITVAQVAKIPLTAFFFTFGTSVYPLTYSLVIPGLIIYGVAFCLGFWWLRRYPTIQQFVIIAGVIGSGLLYLFFDALVPAEFAGAAPRYLIFLLPLFYLAAASVTQLRYAQWLLVPLVLVNLGALPAYWNGTWSYEDDLVNWRAVEEWVSPAVTPTTTILVDGRAAEMARRYFPAQWQIQEEWTLQEASARFDNISAERLIFLAYDYHEDARTSATILLRKIEGHYDETAAWVQYPLFIYVLDRKPGQDDNAVNAATGQVSLQAEIYGLEFQDLRLPSNGQANGQPISINSAFGLPARDGRAKVNIPLATPTRAQQLVLLSNLTNAARVAQGTPVAQLTLDYTDGSTQKIPVRAGYETSAWNQECATKACGTAYTWFKRAALLGTAAYPEAWQEFDAHIFAAKLLLRSTAPLRAIQIERVPSSGAFYVWGLTLVP